MKPVKTASCQSKLTAFETVKEILPLGKLLFTPNTIKQFPYAQISNYSVILLKVKWLI